MPEQMSSTASQTRVPPLSPPYGCVKRRPAPRPPQQVGGAMNTSWPGRLWIVRHGESAGNFARDAAESGGLAHRSGLARHRRSVVGLWGPAIQASAVGSPRLPRDDRPR